ncbi:ABC transporter ATP-binding protein [Rugosimonospora acidiphila]|uniref:ABC transporter ATP-binding protein n=1 Tax=Rugosimonospora acidiphila TaxID=556531 RepID=A0ABP9RL10_9ACTN
MASVLGTGASAVLPLLQRSIVDGVVSGRDRNFWPLVGALMGLGVFIFVTTYLRRVLTGRLSVNLQHDLRTEIFDALSRLDGFGQDSLQIGQILSRSNSDVAMTQTLVSSIPMAVGSLVLFAVSLVVMLVLSPLLTLVALAVVPATWWIGERGRRRLFPATWDSEQQAAEVAGVIDDAVGGVRVVKGFGQEDQEQAKLSTAARRLYASRIRGLRLGAWYKSQMQAIPALGQVGVLALGGTLALRGSITLGTFLAFWAYLAQLTGPIQSLTRLLAVGQQARASVSRVFEVIDSQPQVVDVPGAVALPDQPAFALELAGVTFGYLPSQPVLRDLSLRVRPGETLALIGTSGSGKSTISLLLPRFYDPQSGSVRVGGHDVRDLTLDSLRARIGLVLEESFLFSESLRANIAFGRPDASDAEVVSAARAAEAHEFIAALPDGYDTVVGERGLTLSGGQRQRVALARALLTDPHILILDDATSAVDARVEADIHRTLRHVMRGRTTLLIAHRRATLGLADRIAVLDEGRLVDVGTREELRARCARYRLLVSGPGEDAEGVDAGEVAVEPEGSLWDSTRVPEPIARQAPKGRATGPAGIFGLMAPSREMLARVAALPPARDEPAVDERAAVEAGPAPGIRALLRPFRATVLGALVLVALDALSALVLPVLTRDGVDRGVVGGSGRALAVVSGIALAVALVNLFIVRAHVLVTARTGERVLYTLRLRMFAHLQRLGLDYYEREMSGRILTRMTTDADAVAVFVQDGLTNTVVSLLTLAGILLALLVISPELGLVAVAALPVAVAATLVFRSVSARAYADAREKVSTVNADLRENVAGLRVTQAYRRETHNRGRFAQRSDAYRAARMRAQRAAAVYFPFIELLSTLVAAGVLAAGTGMVRGGTLTAGGLIAYLIYIELFFSPLQQLSQVFDGYQQAAVGLRRSWELLGTPTSTPVRADPIPVPARLRGELVVEAVRFRYSAEAAEALRGIDLRVAPGETVALVGQTGAGKSTLVKLVFRFYDPTAGAIRIDGTDVRDLDLTRYRHRLALVPQEPYLFPGTVRDAIAYGRPGASQAEVEAAARAAGAHEMIRRLAGGYLHPVAERGRNLSAGQRQLLALARAELVEPDILVMDEPTAALDLATEAAVLRAAGGADRARTTLVVAHRLTTAARADRVVVLDGGRIVEHGTHGELLAAGGAYARMWDAFTATAGVGGAP